ncbi:unnamed protein product [Fusarium graminearum]|uniref:Chromosome 2, complete genome n=1 Tax=Gibberella zeae (strain ATCC MYA-4620 / CBS 123657 / FGSC 9075 / NRRL 31084 / PH-1) TaxID=229533 RepID=A0A098DEP5_GIBZE|nr:unnamed protein product [Fusarium graminearum]CZS80193.1 unnamed protein product [Fusarium graminearum]
MTKAMAILCDVAHFAPGALIMNRANKGVYPDVVSSHESKVNMSLCRMGARQVG